MILDTLLPNYHQLINHQPAIMQPLTNAYGLHGHHTVAA
jgi:hypothetical protein